MGTRVQGYMLDESDNAALASYRELFVWQKAMELVVETYKLTSSMPADERFGLISQMRRAAVSIPSNIAEGYGRRRRGEYLQFLGVANGSLAELETQLIAAGKLLFINRDQAAPMWALCQDVGRLLNNLMNSLEPSA